MTHCEFSAVRISRLRRIVVGTLTMVTAFFAATPAAASGTPKWSIDQLAAFADVIVSAQVDDLTPAWDASTKTIYTHVSISVDHVFKGAVPQQRIVVKQLGGRVGPIGLHVADQADFHVGEHALLFLEVRPRDGTLYTSALWQGKWTVERDLVGHDVATRQQPEHTFDGAIDEHTIAAIERSIARAPRSPAVLNQVEFEPSLVASTATIMPTSTHAFTLLGPLRYLFSPPVDVQAGGQPGLEGGGLREILSALTRWNNAGSRFRYAVGTSDVPPRCTTEELGNGRITISFMDPCSEMSNTGGTLAIGGSYYFFGGAGSVAGAEFNRASEGFIVTNDGPTALQYLTKSGCFENVQTHELGHVLGLGHTTDPKAIMFPTIDVGCVDGPKPLGDDDLAGINFIYGAGPSTRAVPLTPPTRVQVTVNGTVSVAVSWQAGEPPRADPSLGASYRVDFRREHQDGSPLFASVTTTGTQVTVAIPPGLVGDFNAVVTPFDALGDGPPSFRTDFTLCLVAPPPIASIEGAVRDGVARVRWEPASAATSYRGSVGSTPGAGDVIPYIDIGNVTAIESPADPDFSAWVRVYAANACGVSAPVDYFLRRPIE